MPDNAADLTAPAPRWDPDRLEHWLTQPRHGKGHLLLLFCYYLAILTGLLLIYGSGDFVTVPFVYQGF